MDFIFIFGPQAVGKMTVGQVLSEKIHYPLLYNHQTIDVSSSLYEKEDVLYIKFLSKLNHFIFSEYIKNCNSKNGLIYTDVWMLNRNYDNQIKKNIFDLFQNNGWRVFIVELVADFNTRLLRNMTENRLVHKISKREVIYSEKGLRWSEENHILNSIICKDFVLPQSVHRHIIIKTDDKTSDEVAQEIISELSI